MKKIFFFTFVFLFILSTLAIAQTTIIDDGSPGWSPLDYNVWRGSINCQVSVFTTSSTVSTDTITGITFDRSDATGDLNVVLSTITIWLDNDTNSRYSDSDINVSSNATLTLYTSTAVFTGLSLETSTETVKTYIVTVNISTSATYNQTIKLYVSTATSTNPLTSYDDTDATLMIINRPPNTFGLLAPTNNISTNTVTPAFGWQDSTDPDPGDTVTYEICYSTSSLFTVYTSSAGLTMSTYTPSLELTENATYWWVVISTDGALCTWSSSTFTVRINAIDSPPNPFNLICSSGIAYVNNPFMDWNDATDPDPDDYIASYTIYWATNPEFALPISSKAVTVSSYTLTYGLVENATHWWKVQAKDNDNLTTWFSTWTFILNALNSAPSNFYLLTSSGIVNTRTPFFDWTNSSDEDPGDSITYTLWYSSFSSYDVNTGTRVAGLTVSSYTPTTDLVENATYWWSVRAREVHPPGSTFSILETVSSTWTVRINQDNNPPLPFNLLVSSGMVYTSTVFLDWEGAIDPDPDGSIDYYVVWWSTNSNFVPYSPSANLPVSQYSITYSLTENATHWWKVQAKDKDTPAPSTTWSSTWTFILNALNSAPSNFYLLTSSGIVNTRTPFFDWTNSSDEDPGDSITYTLWYSSFSSYDVNTGTRVAGLTVSSYTPTTDLVENATYWWSVRAREVHPPGSTFSILETVSSTWTVIINKDEEPPDSNFVSAGPIFPRDNQILTVSATIFQWVAAVDPDPGGFVSSYTVTWSWKSGFSGGTTTSSTTVTTSLLIDGLWDNTTWYWKVRAIDNIGWATDSSTWTVRVDFTNTPSSVPGLLSPPNYEIIYTSYPVFQWQASSGNDPWDIVKYTIEYSTYADFSFSVSSAGISNLNYSAESALKENAIYWWRVTAYDYYDYPTIGSYATVSRSTGTVSGPWIFYVNASSEPPQAFSFRSPAKGVELAKEKNSKRPFFDWGDTADVDPGPGGTFSYTIYYSTDSSFAVFTSSAGLAVSAHSAVSALIENTTYYWKVKAVNGTNLETWATLEGTAETTSYFRIPIIDRPKEVTGVKGNLPGRAGNLNLFTLSWSSVTKNDDESEIDDLAGYRIYSSSVSYESGFYLKDTILSPSATSWSETVGDIVNYYLLRAVDTSGIESKDSAIVNSKLEVIWQDEKKEVSITLPEEVNQVFYKDNEKNPYGSDLKVAIAEKAEDKGGFILGVYEFKILKAGTTEEIKNFSFSQPVEIKFSYGENPGAPKLSPALADSDKAVFWHNGVEYINLGGRVAAKSISIKSKEVGKYRVQDVMRATSFQKIGCEPWKIFTPNGDGKNDEFKIRCANPALSPVSGEVYDITGAYVDGLEETREDSNLQSVLVWEGKDKDNNSCRDGVYIYQIKAEGKTINGTVILAK